MYQPGETRVKHGGTTRCCWSGCVFGTAEGGGYRGGVGGGPRSSSKVFSYMATMAAQNYIYILLHIRLEVFSFCHLTSFFRVDIIPAPSSSHPRTSPEDEETVIGYKIMYGSAYGPGARWC